MAEIKGYAKYITEDLKALRLTADVAQVEAWMRLEHGTLGSLSPRRFRAEVKLAVECIVASTPEQNANLTKSFGL